jgi:hypothetical protein
MQAIAAYMATVNCVPRLQPPPGTETMQRGKTRPPVTLGRHPSELRDAREPPDMGALEWERGWAGGRA